jgi:hypothetical protein
MCGNCYDRKIPVTVPLFFTTSFTWTQLGLNPCHQDEQPLTNRLNHGVATRLHASQFELKFSILFYSSI